MAFGGTIRAVLRQLRRNAPGYCSKAREGFLSATAPGAERLPLTNLLLIPIVLLSFLALASASSAETVGWNAAPNTNLLTGNDARASVPAGVTVTTSGSVQPTISGNVLAVESGTTTNGSTGVIRMQMTAANNGSVNGQTVTFSFSEPVYNLQFTVVDLDGGPTYTGNFTDWVYLNSDAGLPTSVVPNTPANVTWNAAQGRAEATSNTNITDATGNILVTFAGPVTSVTVRHTSGPTLSSPTNQWVFIDDLTFTRSPLVTISKVSNGGTGTFSFTGTNGFASHNVTTATSGTPVAGPTRNLTTQGVATTLTEGAPPAGFALTGISCSGLGSGAATPNLATRSVTLSAAAIVPGASIACTFTNTRATIKVQKITVGGTGTFSFADTNITGTIANISTSAANTPTPAAPTASNITTIGSAVTITETPAAGYALTAASCTDANSAVTGNTGTIGTLSGNILTIPAANVIAGSDFTCVFTNTRATVKVQKVTTGGFGGPFNFADTNVSGAIASISTTAVNTATPAVPTASNINNIGNAVTITETPAAGYVLTSASCTDANAAVTGNTGAIGTLAGNVLTIPAANVRAGSDFTCVFTNALRPTVKFQKQSVGGTATFSFNTPVNIASAPANINTATSNPGPAAPTAINVTTIGSQVQLTEAAVAGYAMTGFSCTDANSAVTGNTGTFGTFNAATRVVTIPAANIVAGADLTCLITNTRATVKFRKQSLGGTASFSFGTPVNLAAAPAAIDTAISNPGPASPTAINVTTVGSQVQLTEAAVAGYTMTGFSCTDANGATTGNTGTFGTFNAATRVVTIPAANVVAGADLTCTITNTKTPTVKFQKQSLGGTAVFSFNAPVNIASPPANIDTGISNPGPASPTAINVTTIGSQVQLTEAAVTGYAMTGFSCTDANSAVTGNTGTFGSFNAVTRVVTVPAANIVVGADLTCVIANSKLPTITITKISNGGTGAFSFTGTNGFGSEIITTLSSGGFGISGSLHELSAASTATSITETSLAAGFVLDSISCSGLGAGGSATPNLATATIDLDAAAMAPGANIACTFTNGIPGLTVTKTGTLNDGGDGVANAGDTISYSFTITNTGTVTLTNVSASDPGATISGGPIASLAPAAVDSTTITGVHTLTQAEIDSGSFANMVTITANPPTGPPISANDTETVTLPSVPTFTVIKAQTVGPNPVTALPATLTYTITVDNTGNRTLTAPTISDSLVQGTNSLTLTSGPTLTSGDTNSDNKLDTTEVWVYTATYAVTQANIDDGGNIVNTATFDSAETTPVTSAPVATPITQTPGLTMVKTASTAGPVGVNDVITYTYTITNTGNVTISGVTVNDTHNGYGTPPAPGSEAIANDQAPLGDSTDAAVNSNWDVLAPGDSVTFTSTYTVTQTDVDLLQ